MFFGGGPSTGVSLRWDDTKKLIKGFGTTSGGSWPIEITTAQSTVDAGRGSADGPKQGDVVFPNGLFVGSSINARFIGTLNNTPSSGKHARGDFYFNNSTTTGKHLGWVCSVNGTPGQWKPVYFAPDVTGNKAARLRVNTAEDAAEWTEGPKAGTDTIADTSATVAVTLATAFASANYSVALAADGDERVWVTSKATTGFTLNRLATSGARAVDWTATPLEDL
jgi:hypothetical protein